jgi:polyhydroxyalkanoate synthesis regulator phasin
MKGALERAQTAASGARERLDFVSQAEHDALSEAVEQLRGRVAALEAKGFGDE